jgi:DNA-directed RNA polymerase specialized sigma24 family protein
MEYNNLYDNHKQTLLRFVGTLVRNEAEAQELVDEIVSPGVYSSNLMIFRK